MDETIKKLVIGSILVGIGKATYLKLASGTEFHNPHLVTHDWKNAFGVKIEEGEDQGDIRIIRISEVETIY